MSTLRRPDDATHSQREQQKAERVKATVEMIRRLDLGPQRSTRRDIAEVWYQETRRRSW